MKNRTILEQIGRLIPLVACIGLLWCCLTLLEDPGIYLGLMLIGIVVPLKYIRIRSARAALLLTAWIIFLMAGMSVLITQSWPKPDSSYLTDKINCLENIQLLRTMIAEYEYRNGEMPPLVSKDQQGNELHGWRTHLLPLLPGVDVTARLDLDQPWDSAENLVVLEKSPANKMFRCPKGLGVSDPVHTQYVAYTGADSAWDPSTDADPNNQILLLETDRPIRWFEPRDLSAADLPEGVTDPRRLTGGVHYYDKGLFHYRSGDGGHVVYRSGRTELFMQKGAIEPRWKNIALAAGILLSFTFALVWPTRKSENKSDRTEIEPADEPFDDSTNSQPEVDDGLSG